MKKNNKGFFLAETIVMISLVTTVMAFLYPNLSNLYKNYKLQLEVYDQTEDIYTLKAFVKNYKDNLKNTDEGKKEDGYMNFIYYCKCDYTDRKGCDILDSYSGYKDYKNKMKITNYDLEAKRLIGVFGSPGNYRFASIKYYED